MRNTYFKKSLGILLFSLAFLSLNAQLPEYTCQLVNASQPASNIFEFDIRMTSTNGGIPFEYASAQYGVTVNPVIKNGGTITAYFVTTSNGQATSNSTTPTPPATTVIDSDLPFARQPNTITFTAAQNCIKVSAKTPAMGTFIPTTPGYKVCRIRLVNTVDFATATPNLTWSFTVTPYKTDLNVYVNSLNTVATNQAYFTDQTGNPLLNPPSPPIAYNVTGGGSYCEGTGGLPVGLDNSEVGATYTFYKDGIAQTPTVAGTGSAISFGNQLAGTYTVSGTNTGGTTPMTGSAVITEIPAIPVSVSINADATSVCSGTLVTFTATPTNGGATPAYQWYVNGNPVGPNADTYAYIPANNDQVHVVMTSNLPGCLSGNPATSNTVTMSVTAPGAAGVSITASNNPSCGGEIVTFTATPVNGGTPSYQWYLDGAPAGLNQPTFNLVPATGSQVYVVMTSSLPCATGSPATSNTITMTVNTPVDVLVSISPSANPVCAGTPVTFTATPTNGGVTPSYQWYKNGSPAGLNQDTYTYSPANNDQVFVMLTSSISCTNVNPVTSSTITMTVNALPVPTIAGPNSACAGSTGNTYTTQAGMTNYVWNVSAGGSITAGGTPADDFVTVTWNTAGAQSVSVNYTNASNCSAVSPVVYNVTVNPLPVPVISGPASACVNSTGNVYATASGMTGYTWTVSAGGTVTAGAGTNAITVTWNTTGAQSVSVNYTNANLCTAVAPTVYNVTVNALPTPTISGPVAACVASTGNVYSTQAGMSGYTWTVSAGGTITAGAGTSAITVTWNTAGAQSVSVNYTNANSCTAASPTVYPVTVNTLPTPTISGSPTACVNVPGYVYSTQPGMSNYNWTVSAGGTITAGAGTDAITVTWNTTGAKTVTVNYTNANNCTAAAPFVFNVTVNALPVPTISGTTPAGVGTSQVYTTEAGMTNYVWTVSAGGTITGGGTATDNTVTVLWNTAGAQSVSVNYNNVNGCTAATATVYPVTVISIPPAAGPITGTSSVCEGTNGVAYSVAPIPNATGYVWTLPAGATIATGANTNSITVNFAMGASSGIITVYGTNIYGNGAPSPNYAVTVNPLPVPTITGLADVCVGQTGVAYSTQSGMTNYVWTVSAGGTITSGAGTNAIAVTWSTTGSKTVSVTYKSVAGCNAAAPTVLNVTVHDRPVPTITGPANACQGFTTNVYSTEPGMTNYVWTISSGGTVTAGAATNAITVTWNTVGAKTVTVNYQNAAGCAATTPTTFNVTVNPVTSPSITGPNQLCAGTTNVTYTTQPGFSSYNWNISYGGIITSGMGTNQVTVDWLPMAGQRWVSVNYANASGCSALSPASYTVTLLSSPNPTITGPATACQGETVTYTTDLLQTNYLWQVSAGGTIMTGAGTSSITVKWNAGGAQTVSVNYSNTVGCTAPAATVLNVTVNPLPAAAGAITGPATICAPAVNQVYTVAAITNATGYLWTIPTGATIVSGANTNSITVSFAANAVSGSIKVQGTNDCGNGTASSNFSVTVKATPATPVITQHGDTLMSSAATGNQWYKDGELIAGATAQDYVVTEDGTYYVIVTVNGCSSAPSNSITMLNVGTGLVSLGKSFQLFPNPNQGEFDLRIETQVREIFTIEVFSSLGELVWKQQNVVVNGLYNTHIDLGSVSSGIYTVTIRNKQNSVAKKVVVMK